MAAAAVGAESRTRGMRRGGGGGGAGRFRGPCGRHGGGARTEGAGAGLLGARTGGAGAGRLFRPISAGRWLSRACSGPLPSASRRPSKRGPGLLMTGVSMAVSLYLLTAVSTHDSETYCYNPLF